MITLEELRTKLELGAADADRVLWLTQSDGEVEPRMKEIARILDGYLVPMADGKGEIKGWYVHVGSLLTDAYTMTLIYDRTQHEFFINTFNQWLKTHGASVLGEDWEDMQLEEGPEIVMIWAPSGDLAAEDVYFNAFIDKDVSDLLLKYGAPQEIVVRDPETFEFKRMRIVEVAEEEDDEWDLNLPDSF